MYDYAKIAQIKSKYKDLHCLDEDFYMQYVTLEKMQPEIIYELGVGSGEWIVCMNECLSYDPLWIGVENFVSAFLETEYYGSSLPTTPEELVTKINLPNFRHYYTFWEPILKDKIPVYGCRIDMSIFFQEQYDIITDHCEVLFIDDVFKPDYKFRLNMALNSDMGILWEGEKEVCLVRD